MFPSRPWCCRYRVCSKAHTLTVTSVPAELDREAFAVCVYGGITVPFMRGSYLSACFATAYAMHPHQLYQRYQVGIHKDEPNKATTSGYTRFLCSPPFPPADRGMPYGTGDHHAGDIVVL